MIRVVIIGGGWAGCGAAVAARKAGAEVIIIEKTDMLLGCGLLGGIMRNNGRFTAAEEAIEMGGGELFEIADKTARHVNIDFPGHKHATLYDVTKIEPQIRRFLKEIGVEIKFIKRAVDVEMKKNTIKGIILDDGKKISGDVFIETTGSSGPMGNCLKYGNGCGMCIQRCPAFGPRVSISQKAGVNDLVGKRAPDLYGAMSGSCEINKDSLSDDLRKKLDDEGVIVLKLPEELINREKLSMKVCQQYALNEYAENIVLLDTGHVKLMSPYFNLEDLRKIDGLENVMYEGPYAASRGNSIRYMSMAPRDNFMKIIGVENLFCAGEKSGPFVGHTEAIVTGLVAGHNAVRKAANKNLIQLPLSTAIGDIVYYVNQELKKTDGLYKRFTFAGSIYFERMKQLGLYTIDKKQISERIHKEGLTGFFEKKVL